MDNKKLLLVLSLISISSVTATWLKPELEEIYSKDKRLQGLFSRCNPEEHDKTTYARLVVKIETTIKENATQEEILESTCTSYSAEGNKYTIIGAGLVTSIELVNCPLTIQTMSQGSDGDGKVLSKFSTLEPWYASSKNKGVNDEDIINCEVKVTTLCDEELHPPRHEESEESAGTEYDDNDDSAPFHLPPSHFKEVTLKPGLLENIIIKPKCVANQSVYVRLSDLCEQVKSVTFDPVYDFFGNDINPDFDFKVIYCYNPYKVEQGQQ
ncbi:chemokine binding protein [Cetacean poxvirus 1]|nr:chemokine binding protein [Cetacean poxvirus 1]